MSAALVVTQRAMVCYLPPGARRRLAWRQTAPWHPPNRHSRTVATLTRKIPIESILPMTDWLDLTHICVYVGIVLGLIGLYGYDL
jgi:hypothetical protein